MKRHYLATFAGGLLFGWLGALAWENKSPDESTARHADSSLGFTPGKRVAGGNGDTNSAARLRVEKDRGALSPLHAARLAEALREPVADAPSDASAASAGDQRFNRWLEQSGLSLDLRTEIAAAFAKELATGGTPDPLLAGSPFDQWLHGRLDQDSVAAWSTLLDEHRSDVIERRANYLLTGLQDAVALSSDQKDAIYPKLTEWVRGELKQAIIEGKTDSTAREAWIASRYQDLITTLPADQHGAIADWLAEFLPAYWLAEDTAR